MFGLQWKTMQTVHLHRDRTQVLHFMTLYLFSFLFPIPIGKVELTLNPTTSIEGEYEGWENVESEVAVVIDPSSLNESYRYMNDEILGKADGMYCLTEESL